MACSGQLVLLRHGARFGTGRTLRQDDQVTLLLTWSDLEPVLDPAACVAALRRGFTAGKAGRAEAFAARHGARLGLDAAAVTSSGGGGRAMREAVRDAGIVVTATWARRPILDAPHVPPG